MTKLQSDVSKLSSSIATINQRIVDNQISNTNNANHETLNVQPSAPTYAEVIASPVSTRDSARLKDSSQNLTNEITTTSPPTKIETNKQVGISEKRESGKINNRRTQHYGNRESMDTESATWPFHPGQTKRQ